MLCSLPRLRPFRAAPMRSAALPAGPTGGAGTRRMVTQMAHPRRVAKVAKQIEREVGQLLISDKVLQQAVCPERRRGFDGAVSALASVTEVQISNDLQVAKVYLSIYSDELGVAAAMEGLQKLEGYVRKHIGRQIRLRLTPEVRFVLDDSLERTERVYKLLDQVRKIESGQAEPPPIAIVDGRRGQDEEDAGDDWEDEDEAMEVTVDLGLFDEEEALVRPQQQRQRQRRQPSAAGGGGGPRGRAAAQQQQVLRRRQPGRAAAAAGELDGFFDDLSEAEFELMVAEFREEAAARRRR